MSAPIRAVAYYRMSRLKQEASIPEQKEWVQRAAKTHTVELLAHFQDHGISGDEIERRVGLTQLLAWCATHEVEAVVVWDADRLSRADSIKTAAVLNTLMQSGVTRFLTHEGWIDLEDDVDRLLFHIRQDMSRAAYSKSNSRNVTRSALERARQGKWVAGRPPYAYRIGEDGHLALGDPQMVETVRWIFHQFATTADSCGDICRKLIERGAPPPPPRRRKDGTFYGGHWQRGIINDLLACRAYLGEIAWNISTHGKYSRVAGGEVKPVKSRERKACRHNDPADWIITLNAHPVIIDAQTFETCQKKLAKTCRGRPGCRSTPIPGGGDWQLSGLLYCGACGGRMVGVTQRYTKKGKQYVYRHYVCVATHRVSAGTCHRNGVKQEVVIDEVAKLIEESFTDSKRLQWLSSEIERRAGQEEGEREAERSRIRTALAGLDVQIDQGHENLLLLPKDRHPALLAKLKEWEGQRSEIALELAKLNAVAEAQADYAQRASKALDMMRHLRKRIKDAPPDKVRNALAACIERITLFFDYGPPHKNGLRPTTFTSLEVQIREEVAALLGEELRQSPQNTA
jgi:site-specific DNA recombinase